MCLNIFHQKQIYLLQYLFWSAKRWKGKRAILLKTYQNISGGILEKGEIVTINFKMQKKHFGKYIHCGMFYVNGSNDIDMGGVDYKDIFLHP